MSQALKSFPKHYKHMALFLDWSNATKEEAVKAHRKSSDKGSARSDELEHVLYAGTQRHIAFAFDVTLDYGRVHTSEASRHGGRLALGGRYAGKDYVPRRGHHSAMTVSLQSIASRWNTALPLLRDPSSEVPNSVLKRLLASITQYFKERKIFAFADFHSDITRKHIAERAKEQAKEVKRLFESYEKYLTDGLAEKQLSVAQVHQCWFDLLYEFCKEFGGVPEAAPLSFLAPVPASSALQHAAGQQPTYHQQPLSQQRPNLQIQGLHPQSLAPRQQRLAPGGQPRSQSFVGKPVSADIVGPKLATFGPPAKGCHRCQGGHWSFECPQGYSSVLSAPCPGFDSHGTKIPSAWQGNDITKRTKDAWRAFIQQHNLQAASVGAAAGAPAVDFS
jgi:hypothetical protein